MIGTFAAILIFTMLKELYEDLHRMRGDYKVNHNKCSVLVKDKAEGDAES